MPITYSAFGNFSGQELWNFFDPSDDDSEVLSTMRAEAGATANRVVFVGNFSGTPVSITVNGQFPVVATGSAFGGFIQNAQTGTATKIEIRVNGQLTQTEEYAPAVTGATLSTLWDSIPGLQAGFAGDDTFNGSSSTGQKYGDKVNGYAGNDSFYGNGDGGDNGPDLFFGGSGIDTAFYRGSKSNYTITAINQIWDPQSQSMINTNGKGFRIKDNTGVDGTDELYEVEFAQFSDQKYTLITGASTTSTTTSASSSTSSSVSSSALPVIAAAPSRGAVTIITYEQNTQHNFFEPNGKTAEDLDFLSLKIDPESTTSLLVHKFQWYGKEVRIEISGSIATDPKAFSTLGQLINRYPNGATTSSTVFKVDGVKWQEEIYATPQRGADLIDQEFSLSKLEMIYGGNDVFIGSIKRTDPDEMNGYGGDDTFYPNAGMDIIHGGDGTDTVVFQGKYAEYVITSSTTIKNPVTGQSNLPGFIVKDTVQLRDGADGDQLYQIERLQFSDYVVSLPDLKTLGTVGPASGSSSTSGSGSSSGTITAGSTGTSSGTTSGVTSGATSGSTSSTTTGSTATTTPTTTTPAATTPVAPIIPNGTEKSGSDAVDRLQGGSGPDVIRSGGGNDVIIGSDGNDYIDGGTGVDQLSYSSRAGSISFAVDTGGNVQVRLGSKTDTLVSVERVSFTDKAYALDLDGSAGKAAKAIIAAFGKNTVSQYLGIALTMTDKGSSIADLAKIVIDNKMLPSDNGQFVQTVFNNVVGRAPNALELLQFKGILDRGEMNTTQLLTLAAQSTFTETVINEVAIAGVALEYQPTLSI